jgi:N-succinyldiaminopimelate aminotransferase
VLLRGINVGRAKRVAMAELRALLEDAGYTAVRTHLNSGNVVLTGEEADPSEHAARIEAAIRDRLGMDVRCAVLTADELRAIAEVANEHDLLVVTDEVYEHLAFDGAPHIPLVTYPGMRERTVSISSAGKTFAVTGWKIGWVCSTPELVTAVRTAKQFLTYVSGGPLQPAVATALALGDEYYDELRASLQAKRDRLCAGLAEVGFDVFRPQGTYFVTTDVRSLGYDNGVEFCRMLPQRCGVVAIPHEVFYDHVEVGRPLVRWAFCKRDEVLDEAVERLRKAFTR